MKKYTHTYSDQGQWGEGDPSIKNRQLTKLYLINNIQYIRLDRFNIMSIRGG